MNNARPFWLVWNESGHAPTFKHDSEESARREAERLARNNPGQQFHVLQVVGTCQHKAVEWHEYEYEPPF